MHFTEMKAEFKFGTLGVRLTFDASEASGDAAPQSPLTARATVPAGRNASPPPERAAGALFGSPETAASRTADAAPRAKRCPRFDGS